MTQKSDWALVWEVNADALRACGSGVMAWITWQGVGSDFYFLGFLSVIFGFAGVVCIFRALANAVRLIQRLRVWKRFRAQGTAPRADGMASSSTLDRENLLK